MLQSQALTILKTGVNVFLTGEPGAGKTHVINEYVAYLRAHGIEPAITASTGIAATHIGGMTIHAWSGIQIKTKLEKRDLSKIAGNKRIAERIRRAKILIIDEVSMLAPGTLSMVDAVCREIKKSSAPFGGIQIVLVGDFFQLPPVVKAESTEEYSQILLFEEAPARFAYDSPAWKSAEPVVCYITEQYRQDDENFLDVLSSIRRNIFDAGHMLHIESRKVKSGIPPADVPKLYSRNIEVDRVNTGILRKLPGEEHSFKMSEQGPDPLIFALKKGCLSPDGLCLKIGASVMFTKNNLKEGYVNGTLGIVQGFDPYDGRPIVKTRNEKFIKVEPVDWMIEENDRVLAKVTQLPLRLAWALTVHKSQGMSLDEAVMDLRDVFEFGQGYVALSRVRRLSGLHLLGWNKMAFQVHPEVLIKDEEFRSNSIQTEEAFEKLSSSEIATKQNDFIIACEGRIISEKTKNKSGTKLDYEKIRKSYSGAYFPWDGNQDDKLRKSFAENPSVADLAKMFNRTKGAISSRLAKLGLIQIKKRSFGKYGR